MGNFVPSARYFQILDLHTGWTGTESGICIVNILAFYQWVCFLSLFKASQLFYYCNNFIILLSGMYRFIKETAGSVRKVVFIRKKCEL